VNAVEIAGMAAELLRLFHGERPERSLAQGRRLSPFHRVKNECRATGTRLVSGGLGIGRRARID